jgi:ribosomal protein L16/L10AE
LASPRTNRSISESLAYDARNERFGTAGIVVAERHAIAETEIETARQRAS